MYCIILYYTVMYCYILLAYTVLSCAVLYCIVLQYCIVLWPMHFTVLYLGNFNSYLSFCINNSGDKKLILVNFPWNLEPHSLNWELKVTTYVQNFLGILCLKQILVLRVICVPPSSSCVGLKDPLGPMRGLQSLLVALCGLRPLLLVLKTPNCEVNMLITKIAISPSIWL